MKIYGIIPARYNSTRFPGKPLVDILGKSMVQRVYGQVKKATLITDVIVATDDQRIYDHVLGFGGTVCMTREDHKSGTDRCAEIAVEFDGDDVVINIQGDEPFIHEDQIDRLIQTLLDDPNASIGTLARKIVQVEDLIDTNKVKVVFDKSNRAIYFSRHAIPFQKGRDVNDWLSHQDYYNHIGLYGFRCETLLELSQLPPSSLELSESLEQLRWLENGYAIHVGITDRATIGVDTEEDLEQIINSHKNENEIL